MVALSYKRIQTSLPSKTPTLRVAMTSLPPPHASGSFDDLGHVEDAHTTESQRRALHIVRDALATDPSTRDDLILSRCGPDSSLRAQVDALLRAVATRDLHTQTSAVAYDEPPTIPEGSFGPFQPIRFLGRGGMADVWLARRQHRDFDQEVALKIMHHDLLRQQRRFRDERQILARLNHPNIAHLIDGGVGDDGHPWLALEYVDGQRITDWCDAHGLDLRDRVKLMLPVCNAVGYAHRSLVVHRDIKPGNILVTAEGVPKLLDFGIAKLLDQTDPEQTGTLTLTPAYASPEQRRGEPVGTASDVYQLGGLLQRMLAGPSDQNPLPTAAGPPSAPPSRPKDDLDRILAKATRDDPDERYGSARELAEDLQRWLDNRPVLARRGGLAYRTRKFLRRNRLAAALFALVACSLAASVGGIVWQRDQARVQTAQAQALKTYLVDMFKQADGGAAPTALTARDILGHGAEQLKLLPDTDELRYELLAELLDIYYELRLGEDGRALALRELGQAPRGPDFDTDARLSALSGWARAQSRSTSHAQALAVLTEAIEAFPGPVSPTFAAANLTAGALALDAGQFPRGEALLRRALATQENLLARDDPELAMTRTLLANCLAAQRRHGEARRLAELAIAEIADADSRWRANVFNTAGMHRALAGDFEAAETLFAETRRLSEILGDPRQSSWYATIHLHNALDRGRFDLAHRIADAEIERMNNSPLVDESDRRLVITGMLASRGGLYGAAGEHANAAHMFDQALADGGRLTPFAQASRAFVLLRLGDTEAAHAALADAGTLPDPETGRATVQSAMTLAAGALIASVESRHADALAGFDRALAHLDRASAEPSDVVGQLFERRYAPIIRAWHGEALLAAGLVDEARTALTGALTLAQMTLGPQHPCTHAVLEHLARLPGPSPSRSESTLDGNSSQALDPLLSNGGADRFAHNGRFPTPSA